MKREKEARDSVVTHMGVWLEQRKMSFVYMVDPRSVSRVRPAMARLQHGATSTGAQGTVRITVVLREQLGQPAMRAKRYAATWSSCPWTP